MSRRFSLTLTTAQYEWLDAESDRSSVPIAEIIRRALDTVHGPHGERRVVSITHTTGRRPGRQLDPDYFDP